MVKKSYRMIDNKYDLVIIGTGVAASHAANKCSSADWRVAIIDYRPFGGTCALRGCDPKKVLVSAEEAIDWSFSSLSDRSLGLVCSIE
jgi:glutathione reductase (NADPH)